MNKTVLLVEDEIGLIDSLKTEFEFENYNVLTSANGIDAVDLFLKERDKIDLILLDWMLPKLDGLGVLRRIKKDGDVPIIMLTARDYTGDKVAGLLEGADDYVTKPFDTEELLARMEVVLRRPSSNHLQGNDGVYRLDDLIVDNDKHQVIRGSHNIQLTQREFNLLLELIKHSGKTFTRDELINSVWGVDFDGLPTVVDVYIRYLRNKIDRIPGENKLIHTTRGVGYSLSLNR
ncbi:response regulator transcription factor [Paucilactobacillus suebicus]|uniref:Winged helix family two component transcriptional regulator n=1 Tax=Paucilactobacillus suebicus DSM 5007 = KCTC 3549 TaxID=1423807 RepID=A0A0R1W6Q1_9LACO|nr:response regulator transcription factor [Paucilactobacillus suebicus]KRM13135.1 winged helix family two component transcriptional regulator [Paucilactobacillus suebicus DSM 5007 = KCTC 3549]